MRTSISGTLRAYIRDQELANSIEEERVRLFGTGKGSVKGKGKGKDSGKDKGEGESAGGGKRKKRKKAEDQK